MEPIRKINDEIAISGQITLEQLSELAQDGYRAILNLRSPDEKTFLPTESQKAEYLDLYYINIPLLSEAWDSELTSSILRTIQDLPKPVLIHCDTALRAAAIALVYVATQQGVTLSRALQQATDMGLVGSKQVSA